MGADWDRAENHEPSAFTATVRPGAAGGKGVPDGAVQFTLDGKMTGEPVELEKEGRAIWQLSEIKAGDHRLSATYVPAKGSVFISSSSFEIPHFVLTAKR